MSNEQAMQVKEKQEIADAGSMAGWGDQVVTGNDIVIEKILPMQFMSEKVKDRTAEYGELRGSLNNDKFGDVKEPLEFIPVSVNKFFIASDIIVKKDGTRNLEYRELIPIQDNPLAEGYNDDWGRTSKDGMTDYMRVMEFYVLLPKEVEEGTELPYILSFKSTSSRAGKKLMTICYVKNRAANKVPPATACLLSLTDKENDKGQFCVQDVTSARPSTDKEIQAAFKWYKIINSGGVKVDNSDIEPKEVTEEVHF